VWQYRNFLFFPAQVHQDLVYGVLIFKASYDFGSPTATVNRPAGMWSINRPVASPTAIPSCAATSTGGWRQWRASAL